MRIILISFLFFIIPVLHAGEIPDYYVDVQGVRQQGHPVFFLKHSSVYEQRAWQSSAINRFNASVDIYDSRTSSYALYYNSYLMDYGNGRVGDYFGNIAFWNDDTLRWIRVGEDINTDNWYYARRFNGEVDWGMPADYDLPQIHISPNDPTRVYLQNFISADSGYTFEPGDGVAGYLGEAPGYPHIRYASDYEGRALVSGDSGSTWMVSDSIYNWSNSTLIFDADKKHVYAPFSIYDSGPLLYRSDSLGLPGSWRETAAWSPIITTGSLPETPLIVKAGTTPGVLFAAYHRALLKSEDFGESFTVLYRHDSRISGMEALGDSLYFTDAYRFFSFINGDTTLIHSRDISGLVNFFPMNLGDRWVYRKVTAGQQGNDTTYVDVTITGDQQINGHTYMIQYSMDGSETRYLRRDSRSARIYEYFPNTEKENVWLDLSTAPNDSAHGYYPLNDPAAGIKEFRQKGEALKTVFDSDRERVVRQYTTLVDESEINSQLAWGIGMISRSSGQQQGASSLQLTGAVIDGKLYGDTTVITNLNKRNSTPLGFRLYANYPNPFNPSTTIRYSLPAAQKVKLVVYDVNGRLLQTLVDSQQAAGSHSVTFDATNLSSGVYYYKLTNENGQTKSQKMILLK